MGRENYKVNIRNRVISFYLFITYSNSSPTTKQNKTNPHEELPITTENYYGFKMHGETPL